MSRFDKYIVGQMSVMFGFFSLVLVSIYWINRAVKLFDQLIADGHSTGVFIELSLLSLPTITTIVLPISTFAAVVFVINRLNTESELVVMQATGFSPWRLMRPVWIFGCLVALLLLSITTVIAPLSEHRLNERQIELSSSASARLLREGVFMHPTRGVTVYITDITQEGELQGIFLSDRRSDTTHMTYTAGRAYLVRTPETVNLVMVDGQAQTLRLEDNSLATTLFADLNYDVSDILSSTANKRRNLNTVPTSDLLFSQEKVQEITRASQKRILRTLNTRFHEPLLCLSAALLGFAGLIIGRFSRFGSGRQILFTIALLISVKLIESLVNTPLNADLRNWPLVYAPALYGILLAIGLVHIATRPMRRTRGVS